MGNYYKTVAIAGTFDHFHRGHEEFILRAFRVGDKVTIGLTTDRYVRENSKLKTQNLKLKFKIQNYQEREENLKNFLIKNGLLKRSTIVKIDNIYGPAIEKKSGIEALVVTSETIVGARLVNRRRKELGFKPLELIKIPLAQAEDRRRISSRRIRMGEIDREGKVISYKLSVTSWPITEKLRQDLKRPIGILIKGDPDNHEKIAGELKKTINKIQPVIVTTIGDEVTKMCNQIGIFINLAVFDYKVRRIKKYNSLQDIGLIGFTISPFKGRTFKGVRNPAGHVTATLIEAVKKAYRAILGGEKQRLIRVIGEEDLAGLPAVLLAPLDSVVIYGQPDEGVVVVEVTEEKKSELMRMIKN